MHNTLCDKYGHLVGDQILTDVAARMKAALRTGDILGRYGGEKFLLVLPRADINIARQITERICNSINARLFQVDDYAIPVTISIGVADWRTRDSDEDLLGRADHSLYRAKNQGRNQVIVANKVT